MDSPHATSQQIIATTEPVGDFPSAQQAIVSESSCPPHRAGHLGLNAKAVVESVNAARDSTCQHLAGNYKNHK